MLELDTVLVLSAVAPVGSSSDSRIGAPYGPDITVPFAFSATIVRPYVPGLPIEGAPFTLTLMSATADAGCCVVAQGCKSDERCDERWAGG